MVRICTKMNGLTDNCLGKDNPRHRPSYVLHSSKEQERYLAKGRPMPSCNDAHVSNVSAPK